MKKAISVILSVFMVLTFVACGGAESPSTDANPTKDTALSSDTVSANNAAPSQTSGSTNEPRTIKWMTIRNNGWTTMTNLFDEYMAANPNVQVEFETLSDNTSYYQKLRILAANNDLPDLFDSDADTALAQMASTGALLDIDELYKELSYDRMTPIGLNYGRLENGKLYSISWENNIEYFWFHKDMFAKAGIEKKPETFDELIEACEKLKNAGITPITSMPGWASIRWLSFVPFRLTGNDFIEKLKVGEAKMSDPVGMQAIELFQEVSTNYFEQGWTTNNYTNALESFLGGHTAIYYIATSQFKSFLDDNKEIKDDFDFFYLPTLPGAVNDKTAMVSHAGTGTSIRKDTFDDTMKDFVKFLLDNYPEKAFFEDGKVPGMTFDKSLGHVSEFYKQVLEDGENLSAAAYCWDVRMDPASTVVLTKELQNLGMGAITPQEFAKRIDDAIAENAPKFFS